MHAKVTTVFCTPTYALRLAEVAAEHKINLAICPSKKSSSPASPAAACRPRADRIESAWSARVFDHGGATEIGPWGFADADGRGLHINEAAVHRRVRLGRNGPSGPAKASCPT